MSPTKGILEKVSCCNWEIFLSLVVASQKFATQIILKVFISRLPLCSEHTLFALVWVSSRMNSLVHCVVSWLY